jgi:hypothetical protein
MFSCRMMCFDKITENAIVLLGGLGINAAMNVYLSTLKFLYI